MSIDNIGLLNGMMSKMKYLGKKQEVFAQNISNADTPGYQPKTLKNVDFSRYMEAVSGPRQTIRIQTTDDQHMPTVGKGNDIRLREQSGEEFYELSPDGNSVIIEEQLYKSANNAAEHQAMVNLYRRNIGMLRLAINGAQG